MKTFNPVQWPTNVSRTKKQIFGKKGLKWSDEELKIFLVEKSAKHRQVIITSNYDSAQGKVVGETAISVLVENEQGVKLYYLCDRYYESSANLREIRMRLEADLAVSRCMVRVVACYSTKVS